MGSIFCIGQSAYDITIPLDGAICENQKYRVTQKEECGGGPAFNAAYLCAMWGEKVELISRIGNDTYGKRLLEIAAQAGIGTNYLIKDDEIETPHSYIFSNQENERDLLYGFYKGKVDNITDAIILTQEMTETFFQLVLDCCENGGDINCLFKNLNKFDYKVESMISTRMQNDEDICDWLRLYGLRIGTTIISITGGTIKLTREMRDREHTRQELDLSLIHI